MWQKLEKFERILAILGLLFFCGVFTQLNFPSGVISLIRYGVWLIPTFLLCVRWKSALFTASQDIFIWVVIVLLMLSFVWSDYPFMTLKDNREVLQMTTFGFYLASRFTLTEQIKLIAWAFGIGIVTSVAIALTVPQIGIHGSDHPGAWKGVYGYKNNLGSMMILSSFTFWLLPLKSYWNFIKWILFSLSLALILLSTSKTALVVCFLVLGILLFYRNFRWQGKVTVFFLDVLILVVGLVATVILINWVELLSSLGKDPTLTGRTPMWGVALTRLIDRPFLGYGRNAFWGPGSEYAREAGRAVTAGFVPPHAHNGLIDLALDIGLVGFTFFLFSYILAYGRSLQRAYASPKQNSWYLAFLIFLFLNNITESYLLYKGNIYWTLFVTTALSVGKSKD